MTEEQLLKSILDSHEELWKDQRAELQKYKNAYEGKFWETEPGLFKKSVLVQTPHAYKFIEQYVSTLFLRQPAVIVGADPATTNDPTVVEAVANRWLGSKRTAFENSTRQALLYPCSFIKLTAKPFNEKQVHAILESVDIDSVYPWEVIVDVEATSWDTQRYCGHVYDMPVSKVVDTYSVSESDLKPKTKRQFFEKARKHESPSANKFKYCKIVEFYDLQEDKLTIWTPDHKGGFFILDEGPIPLRDADDTPLVGIVPLYFTWKPDMPLMGLSTMGRVYDQVKELNIIRTHRANVVRRNTRKYLFDKTAITDEALDGLMSPEDGTLVGVENLAGREVIKQVANAPIGQDFEAYVGEVTFDIEGATALPQFARGQETGVTATEVGLLNTYASNEIGKMAKQKDECIERVCKLYIRMLFTNIDDDVMIPIEVNDQAIQLKSEHLGGSYVYRAADGGTSPVTLLMKKQQLLEQIPLLSSLGADSREMLKSLVEMYDWPPEFVPAEPIVAPNQAPAQTEAPAPNLTQVPPGVV